MVLTAIFVVFIVDPRVSYLLGVVKMALVTVEYKMMLVVALLKITSLVWLTCVIYKNMPSRQKLK